MAGRDATLLCELQGHSGDINCCSWSPLDQTLCSCSGDKSLRLWSLPDGRPIPPSPLPAHSYYINTCAFSPAGDLLATASSDTTLKLWSTASWTCIGTLCGHDGSVRHCSFSMDGNLLASAASDDAVKVWEVGSLRCIATLTKHDSSVTCCGFAPNGWLLASAGSSGDLIFFNVFSKRSLVKLLGHDLGVNSLQIAPPTATDATPTSPAGNEQLTMVTGGNDNMVRLWSVTVVGKSVSVCQLAELATHTGPVYSCNFSPDGSMLVSGSADKTVAIWDMGTLTVLCRLNAHARYVTHCSFSPDGRHIATASNDRTIKLWTVNSTAPLPEPQEQSPPTDGPSTDTESSLIAGEGCEVEVEAVCRWLEAVRQAQSEGKQLHSDDMRAVQRLASALQPVSLVNSEQLQLAGAEFICPITCEVMRDPVVAGDGYSYERSAIMDWFRKGRCTSPSTNLPLTSTLLVPNRHLKVLIEKHKSSS